MAGQRYIGNLSSGIFHDTFNSTEECNIDDLRRHGGFDESDTSYEGQSWRPGAHGAAVLLWRKCKHCIAETVREENA